MKSLNSKNYDHVLVYLREIDTPIKLGSVKGLELMQYLTTKNNDIKHVKLTDTENDIVVVLTTDIKRIVPVLKTEGLEKYA